MKKELSDITQSGKLGNGSGSEIRNQARMNILKNSGVLTTKQAFTELINIRGIYKKIGKTEMAVKMMRITLKEDRIRQETMEEVLELAGYKVVQEKLWSKE